MSYAAAKADHDRVVLLIAEMRTHLLGDYLAATQEIQDNLDDYDSVTASRLASLLSSHRATMAGFRATARAMLDVVNTRIAEEIGSGTLMNGAISDNEQFFRDWRAYQAAIVVSMDEGETTPARAVTYASDPAAGSGVQYVRLTVDHLGQKIESGLHNETVTAEVQQTGLTGAGQGRVVSVLHGEDGGVDALDYRRGSGRLDVDLHQVNERNAGPIRNNAFFVSGPTVNGTAVTPSTLGGWTLLNAAGTPTVVVRTTNPLRTKGYGIAVSGNGTTARFEQSILQVVGDRYSPRLPFAALRYDGTWEGEVKVYWGNKDFTVAHGAMGSAGFKYLFPPRDKDLYPINFDAPVPLFAVEVLTESASGEVVLQMADMAVPVQYQNVHYFSLPHDAVPVLGTKATWADSVSFAGVRQDVLAWAYEEEAFAYLNTVGDLEWSDPS